MSQATEDQNTPKDIAESLGVSLETYMSWSPWIRGIHEKGSWGQWLSTMTPERLAMFRENEKARYKEYRARNKERLTKT